MARDPRRDQAFEIYKKHKGKISLVEIANQLNVSDGTVRGWKSKDKWEEKLNGTFQDEPKKKRNVPKGKSPPKKEVHEPLYEVALVMENPKLTDKQGLFCLYMTKYFNATKAYQRAYGCSYVTAHSNGSQLLAKTSIQEEIRRLKQAKLNRAMLEPGDIFQKYMDIAFSDITDYVEFGHEDVPIITRKGILFDENGQMITEKVSYVHLNDSMDVDGTLITEVKQGKDGIAFKLADKMKALQWLADHMDLATEEQRAKIALLKAKVSSDDEEDEQEDDGFIEALKGQVDDIWEE